MQASLHLRERIAMSDRVTYKMTPRNAVIELDKDPEALTLRVSGDADTGVCETIAVALDAEDVRALYTGLDLTAPRPPQIPYEVYSRLMNAFESAIVNSETLDDAAMEADDMEAQGEYHDQTAALRELRDDLKVLAGKAKRFDDHFTVIKDDNGDPVDAYPAPASENANRNLWTVLDCDGELCVVPGFAFVNRFQHIMTTEAWTDADDKTEWIY